MNISVKTRFAIRRTPIIKKISIIFIFHVLTLVLPLYFWLEDPSKHLFRDVLYLLALPCSLLLFIFEKKIGTKKIVLMYLAIYAASIVAILLANILFVEYGNKASSISILVTCFESWLAFLIGRYLTTLIRRKYFLTANTIAWVANCCFILSKVDWSSMQALYGREDPTFSGSYQYIGDIFSLTSIIAISQLIGSSNKIGATGKLKILRKNNDIRLMDGTKTLLCLCSIVFCDFLVFLNGSRSSFFSFTFICAVIVWRLRMSITKPIILSVFILIAPFALIGLYHLLAVNAISIDMLLENRNFELLSNNGESSSLDLRTEFYLAGLLDIAQNFFLGNYTQINIDGNVGNYIHNILGIWHYFGIVPFICFGLATIESLKKYLAMFGSITSCENIAYESILIFSLISILLFRNPIGFSTIFVVFGVCSTGSKPKHQIIPSSRKHQFILTR